MEYQHLLSYSMTKLGFFCFCFVCVCVCVCVCEVWFFFFGFLFVMQLQFQVTSDNNLYTYIWFQVNQKGEKEEAKCVIHMTSNGWLILTVCQPV